MEKKKVLFLCTHNSARSQIAEGLLRHLYGSIYKVWSAGTAPSEVDPCAIEVMREIGVDISRHRSKSIAEFAEEEFDYVVTVCNHAKEACPFFPKGKKYLHRSFEDPSAFNGPQEEKLVRFRKVRDEIREWLRVTFADSADV